MEKTPEASGRAWTRCLSKMFLRERDALPDPVPPGRGASRITRARSEGVFVAVASGKGGTGKSFLATNLAVGLSDIQKRVTLVDCDFGMANDHLLLGVNPSQSIQHFLAGTARIDELRLKTPFGPHLIPGGSGISRLSDLSEAELLQLGQGLSRLSRSADVMLMDAAAGISPQSILTLLAAQYVVIVTNPEIAALTDAYALIKCLVGQAGGPQLGVVVNRVLSEGQGESTFRRLSEVVARFCQASIHYLGAVPEEPAVTHHRLNQPPLIVSHPQCQASLAIRGILESLSRHAGLLGPRTVAATDTVEQRFRKNLSRHRTPGPAWQDAGHRPGASPSHG